MIVFLFYSHGQQWPSLDPYLMNAESYFGAILFLGKYSILYLIYHLQKQRMCNMFFSFQTRTS